MERSLRAITQTMLALTRKRQTFGKLSIKMEGLITLKAVATNDYIFIVNEAVNNKMMHYAGVMTEESLPEATRADPIS